MSSPIVKAVTRAMGRIAPLNLAGSWDNVGLILEAPFHRQDAPRVLVTVDLTTAVLQEALSTPTSVVVSYHTPIFRGTKSFTLSTPLQSTLLKCAAAGISVYSPHSALDAVKNGLTDWLADIVAGETGAASKVDLIGPSLDESGSGMGRLVTLPKATPLETLVNRIKKGLELSHVDVGVPTEAASISDVSAIRNVAICAGAGESVFTDCKADLYFTGEMPHHAVLAAVESSSAVILCGHTNTERGYMPTLAARLKELLAQDEDSRGLEVHVSKADRHPLVLA